MNFTAREHPGLQTGGNLHPAFPSAANRQALNGLQRTSP